MKVECMLELNVRYKKQLERNKRKYIANSPSRITLFTSGRDLISLTVYAWKKVSMRA